MEGHKKLAAYLAQTEPRDVADAKCSAETLAMRLLAQYKQDLTDAQRFLERTQAELAAFRAHALRNRAELDRYIASLGSKLAMTEAENACLKALLSEYKVPM